MNNGTLALKRSHVVTAACIAVMCGTLAAALVSRADGQVIAQQLSFGMRGAEVSKLQAFLAQNQLIYPAGIVSGYYGPLTRSAVTQFQVTYDIPQVGRVGPITLAKINSLIMAGGSLDTAAPVITSGITVQSTRGGASFIWMTNEPTRATAYYGTNPILFQEADSMTALPFISGTAATDDGMLRTEHMVTVQGLQPNTTYHYAVRIMDAAGNVTVSLPATFRTQE